MHSPLDQFKIKKIVDLKLMNIDISFTNSSLWMSIAIAVLFIIAVLIKRRSKVVRDILLHNPKMKPTRFQVAMEAVHDLIYDMLKSTAGDRAVRYFPAIFSMFTFVLLCNLVGMLPGSFASTSHIAVTFILASIVFVSITLLGIAIHGFGIFKLFIPSGTPVAMAPILFVIEFIAYLARPISLSLRLASNITAGHIVLKVIASLAVMSSFLSFLPLGLLVILTGFEFATAMLQAYIFAILSCVYLNDVVNMH